MKPVVKSRWRATVLVCAKCGKKAGGGFGAKGKTSLAKLLRRHGGGRKRKAAFGVVETKCLGVCPRNAVTVIDAAHPGRWHVVPTGTCAEEVMAQLGIGVEEAD